MDIVREVDIVHYIIYTSRILDSFVLLIELFFEDGFK